MAKAVRKTTMKKTPAKQPYPVALKKINNEALRLQAKNPNLACTVAMSKASASYHAGKL
jgi:hypothetical protein